MEHSPQEVPLESVRSKAKEVVFKGRLNLKDKLKDKKK